jgi:tetratricopeptide (TPR) repeat protein
MSMPAIHRSPSRTLCALVALTVLLSACATLDQPRNPQYTNPPASVNPAESTGQAPVLQTEPALPPPEIEPSQPLPPPSTRTYTLSAASKALVTQAETQRKTKNFVQAAATLERALRIEPNNPLLWLEYAELREDESNYAQAENLARKAVALASGDPRTQSNAWRVIADSLRARNQNADAQQALAKADALLGR